MRVKLKVGENWLEQECEAIQVDPNAAPIWRDVTAECEYDIFDSRLRHGKNGDCFDNISSSYRLRKVHFHEMTGNDYAFKVEKEL